MRLETDSSVMGRATAATRPCTMNFSMRYLPAAWAACASTHHFIPALVSAERVLHCRNPISSILQYGATEAGQLMQCCRLELHTIVICAYICSYMNAYLILKKVDYG